MKLVKRSLAMLLVAAMLLSFAACGAPKAQQEQTEQLEVQPEAPTKDQATDLQDMDRQDKELIAELVGGNQEADQLTDQELDQLIDQLVGEVGDEAASGVVNLSGNKEQPSVDVTLDPDAYDQDGAITKPFDQVYPELIEKEQVAFSGESILVKMRSNSLTDGLKAAGVGALEKIVPMEGCAWYEAKLTEGTASQKALEAVRQLSEVILAEFNYEVQTSALDDYKHFDKDKEEDFKKNGHNKDQWHFHYCGIPDGYEQMENDGGDKGVIVAVIDSGVDYAHEDLKDNMWVNTAETPDNGIDDDGNGYVDDYYGVDIIDKKGNGDDTNGHGTHVAGIIAARNNNVGVLGIAYNVKIMSVKAAAHNGTLNQADIAKAVLYAYENGAEVINMSFGGSASSIAVQDALQTAYTRCVLVASAGNNSENNEPTAADPVYLPNYPAALTYVLGVMSVDENGVESSFTNYDVEAFNGVEYELYAPGENIMSTLPGNKYGYLSGTSMAAPVVSAFAAILRGEFSDRDMYPTKFIYGQLASTSQIQADCLDPNAHGRHNLPQITDLNAALTKLPKPEVNLQDWAIFDDPKYSANNNGDGVIDAGETIALGLTLRNRWGMSENTLVTIDTLSTAGLSDPYITIKNPTVDFGSVGTYSTKDSGKIFTDELLTGWEEPFLVEISKDCPNDYRFTLNVTITCENALDDADTVVYTTKGAVSDAVRSGYILPAIIEENMVLTKDNLYIIPNATVIQEGVTVRVEPGTHIQFWSNDAKDPYADSYIAYLLVKGNFLVEGTKEEPVYIYPSQLMNQYCVEFGASSNGYISLRYADITNFAVINSTRGNHTGTNNRVSLADHCIFRQNYTDRMYYRYLQSGKVYSGYDNYMLGNVYAKDCVYYQIASTSSVNHFSTAKRCAFVECGILYSGSYQNCVFLKNNYVRETGQVRNSSYSTYASPSIPVADKVQIFYREETGTTYITTKDSSISTQLLAEMGGNYLVPETEDEYQWVIENIIQVISGPDSSFYSSAYKFGVGIAYNHNLGAYTWSDGSPISDLVDPEQLRYSYTSSGLTRLDNHGKFTVVDSISSGYSYYLFEVPGQILPTEITLNQYEVAIDLEGVYQINPINQPVQLPLDAFCYESSDETVVTVNETGLVTPVGKGSADVYIYSLDKAVYNYVTVSVQDYVALDSMSFSQSQLKLAYGETVEAGFSLYPENTTRRNVQYTSSDETIAVVDDAGRVTAVGFGNAVITAVCEGLQAQMQVQVAVDSFTLADNTLLVAVGENEKIDYQIEPANTDISAVRFTVADETVAVVDAQGNVMGVAPGDTTITVQCADYSLRLDVHVYKKTGIVAFEKDRIPMVLSEGSANLPALKISDGAETQLVWKSTDEEVAKIVDGRLQLYKTGATLLMVEDLYTGKADSAYVFVYDKPFATAVNAYYYSSSRFVYRADGTIEMWTSSSSAWNPIIENVDACAISHNHILAAQEDGTLIEWRGEKYYQTLTDFVGTKIRDVAAYYNNYNYGLSSYYVLTEDGSVYSWGGNTYGQLGTGNTSNVSQPTKLELDIQVTQIEAASGMLFLRAENGNLYILGGSSACAKSPMLIDRNTSHLQGNFLYGGLYYADGNLMCAPETGDTPYVLSAIGEYDYLSFYSNSYNSANAGGHYYNGVGVRDGKLTIIRGTYKNGVSTLKETETSVTGVAAAASYVSGNQYNDPIVFFKDGTYGTVSISGIVNYINPAPVPQTELKLLETNLRDGVLSEDALQLFFNKGIASCNVTLYEDGVQLTVSTKCKNNSVSVSSELGFGEGCAYRLVIEPANITGVTSCPLAQTLELEFTYKAVAEPEEDATEEGGTEQEGTDSSDQTQETVIHESKLDETVVRILTPEMVVQRLNDIQKQLQYQPYFHGNAVLNHISTDTNVEHWLRPVATSTSAGTYKEIPFGGNYWGSANKTAIELQMVDYSDFITYARLMYEPYLTQAPENTFPFVTDVKLINKDGDAVTTVGNEQITFRITFNRDMDTTIPLQVRFGSAAPYGDYEVAGQYVDARTWEGTYTLKTTIENGNQFLSIANGCSATDDLTLQPDTARFGFVIDTTAAQALIMQGTATDTGISLRWTQDDFKTLMGYNVYRATKEDGQYTRLNSTVIPADTMEWFDDTVEPGVVYYYNFTVVQTDLNESEPSGKIAIMSKDTMAPNIYHSPVMEAFTGSNLVLSATITDNLNIAYANLYYRTVGTDTWSIIRMNKLNDKYSAIIPASYITVAGVEYYIEAFDGVSSTCKGSAEAPYTIAVQEALDADALGDVDGDGVITNLDALLLLYTINDKYNMTAEEFARADLNGDGELMAAEALRILQYVSGVVGSVKM